ncbi:MAG TPA: OmpA family protein [Terriglobales bacterium]|nr:OmpA family protein [Terriglobales bacterium]
MRQRVLSLSVLVLLAAGSLSAQSHLVLKASDGTTGGIGAASPIAALPPSTTEQREVRQNIRDIHFDFDRADLRPEDRSTLESDAQWLKAHPDTLVTIEGCADERGDIVYNVVLSDERAATAKDALVALGVPAGQIVYATGWGKLYPICFQSDEGCWSQNRRAHFEPW